MTEARRRAYLAALGFDVWVAKPPGPLRDRLEIGAGQGSILLVCATPEEGESAISTDIARALGGDPVWAWPDPEGTPDGPRLEDAVRDHLFTRVIVFGPSLAERLFGGAAPAVLLSSSVSVAGGLDELAVRGAAKRELWALLSQDLSAAREGQGA
jgi:hypothetical protein